VALLLKRRSIVARADIKVGGSGSLRKRCREVAWGDSGFSAVDSR
jgi:hypothetical protein